MSILFDMSGMRLGKTEIIPSLTPKQTASIMPKRRAGKKNSDFNRRLDYPNVSTERPEIVANGAGAGGLGSCLSGPGPSLHQSANLIGAVTTPMNAPTGSNCCGCRWAAVRTFGGKGVGLSF
jgi:hypothetical protein